MRRETTPEAEMVWDLKAILIDAHLGLTPYESSHWEVRERTGETLELWRLKFIIVRDEEDKS